MKGGDQIEADFYEMIKSSELYDFINGSFYREGMRPINARSEDAVISFKTGIDGQFQDGEVVLNIYVPDIAFSGVTVKNINRCREIGNKIMDVVDNFTNGEYNIWLHNIPQSFAEEDIEQHFVNARIRFKRKQI